MRFSRLNAALMTALLCTGAALLAQIPSQKAHPVKFGPAEIDCSSYLTATPPGAAARIAGNAEAMQFLDFSPGDRLQLADVHGLKAGMDLRVLRIDDHWGEFEQFSGQNQQLKRMGHRVVSVGRLRILSTRGTTALARVEAACQPLHAGDFGIPWKARAVPQNLTAPALDVTRIPDTASLAGAGLVAASRDFAYETGPHDEIYLNRGTRQGAHPGQFWLIVRGPSSASQGWLKTVTRGLDTPAYGTSSTMPDVSKGDGLAHVIGQAVVLWAEPSSSTAIVTAANTAIYPGDQIIPVP